ncbi:jg13249 [Pararge aegeria aegeria]|uniref:Jg13249 protein n=1 Tax=Pararge aegeria aegeria TaxID=348720 RepID=A0A8S4RGU1_9NEOP|nr:jg13249 [Pararge aegeria aegeria]
MLAHADYGPCEHLHGIAPALDRPITGRSLPRELLQSPPPAQQRGGTNGDVDDTRPIGSKNNPARAGDDLVRRHIREYVPDKETLPRGSYPRLAYWQLRDDPHA